MRNGFRFPPFPPAPPPRTVVDIATATRCDRAFWLLLVHAEAGRTADEHFRRREFKHLARWAVKRAGPAAVRRRMRSPLLLARLIGEIRRHLGFVCEVSQ